MHLSADVLLVTVNSHETRQLFEAFNEIHKVTPNPLRPRSRTYNDFGEINGMRVLHTLCEMGTSGLGSAQQAIDESITDLQPHSVIMVGVAFGVNPKKQAIGDVLVSRQLSLYEQARVGAKTNIARGDKPHASAELVNYFSNTQLYWSEAKVRIGLALSGEKLVDSPEFRDQLVAQEPEAIGGEMEGAGLYVTCQKRKVDWILVKGICDWADGNKGEDKDARQALAARNAARFVATAFQLAPLKRVTNPFEQAALPEPQSNLGESENAFIGREALVETVQVWATDRTVEWILCLRGPGGVGKTRLAREAGRTLRGQFDRICLVNLESQSLETVTPALVASAMAQTLGLSEGLKEPDKELAGLLVGQKLLLILDNFESADTKATRTWLKDFALTGIKCLVTSRKRWTVRNIARDVLVKRLVVPSSPTRDFDMLFAVQLFRDRLDSEVALAPYATLSDSDRAALVRILQVTEGFPLAIQMVAANLLHWEGTLASLASGLGVKELAYRHDLDESGGGPERHESMGACFQWSLNLLPEDERARFLKLGVFPYDFSPEAAQEICGVSLEDLQRWWQRSLVERDTTPNSTRRFLLSLVREYAREKIRKSDESILIGKKTDYFIKYMINSDKNTIFEILKEKENVVHAIKNCIRNDDSRCLVFFNKIAEIFYTNGFYEEEIMTDMLKLSNNNILIANIYYRIAESYYHKSDNLNAKKYFKKCFTDINDCSEDYVHSDLLISASVRGRYDILRRREENLFGKKVITKFRKKDLIIYGYKKAIELLRDNRELEKLHLEYKIGVTYEIQKDFGEANDIFLRCRDGFSGKDIRYFANSLFRLGKISYAYEDDEKGDQYMNDCLKEYKKINNKFGICHANLQLASSYCRRSHSDYKLFLDCAYEAALETNSRRTMEQYNKILEGMKNK
ncbi:NB-ARC domain-containing protein [Armatimonas rosea]|uniref:Nucleoside phosphorylase/predicted ATPase n=1 Tax=Armatimonas rosea TaxID=685828 RepID=A0A7W9WA28_ARMRO|nr:NB-ARC domain-containing protein [Armatimonas rosea]MBB6053911.1 nucleoside phosphorylase/predicted ATPase [Armatimonas rosea]